MSSSQMAPSHNNLTFISFLIIFQWWRRWWGHNVTESYRSSAGLHVHVRHVVADGIDGKQARRTKSSSPLGELFDHGLDSWATLFFPVGMYSVFGRAEGGVGVFRVYSILLGVMLCFALSHWEKYNTGVLYLPWGYDISQIVSVSQDSLFSHVFIFFCLALSAVILRSGFNLYKCLLISFSFTVIFSIYVTKCYVTLNTSLTISHICFKNTLTNTSQWPKSPSPVLLLRVSPPRIDFLFGP